MNRKAARIYNLVKANRDDEAERELIALGSDSAAVASALIDCKFRNTPRRAVGFLLLAFAPIVLVAMRIHTVGLPEIGVDRFDECIWYAALVVIGYFLEAAVVGSVSFCISRYRGWGKLGDPAVRARNIACAALESSVAPTPDSVGGLLTALEHVYLHLSISHKNGASLDAALLRLLPLTGSEILDALSPANKNALRTRFWRIVRSESPADIYDLERYQEPLGEGLPLKYAKPGNELDARLGIAILRAYEHVQDPVAIQLVRKASLTASDSLPAEWQQLIEAAKRTIPIMQEHLLNSNGRNDLLRGSDAAADGEEELLRPQAVNAEHRVEELLRPAGQGGNES